MGRNIVSVALCCNNPDNGMFTGKFCAVNIGTELLDLDNKYYPPKEPKLSYEFKTVKEGRGFGASRVEGHIKVSRRRFPVIGYKYGWGNWVWDLVIMTPETAVSFLNYLKELDCFQPDSGDEEFFDIFNEPGVQFSEREIPTLKESGYQAP